MNQKQIGGVHYATMAIQPFEYIYRNKLGFLEGSAVKYLSRWKNKGGRQDLQKAIHCIELLIQMHDEEMKHKEQQP